MKKILGILLISLISISIFADAKPVTVAYKGSHDWQAWLDVMKKEYETKFPDKKIRLFPIVTKDDVNYEIKIAMLLKNDPDIDLVFVDSFPTLHTYINAELLEPYPAMQKWTGWNQIYNYMKNGAQKDGKYYCIPVASGNIVLYYSKELLTKAGISLPWNPKTWQNIINTALKVKKAAPDIYPIWLNLQGNKESTTMYTGLSLLYGTGQKLYKNEKWIVTSKGLFDSLNFIYTLRKENLLPPPPVILDQQAMNRMEKEMTPAQKIAIFLDGGFFKNYAWTGKLKKTRELYDITPFPTQYGQSPHYISMAGGWSVSMCAKSSNKTAAWDFFQFLVSKEGLLKASIYSTNTSPRKDVLKMKGYLEDLKKPTEMLKYGQHRPIAENYSLISNEFSKAIESVSTGYTTPSQAMNNFANNVEMSLGKDKIAREYKE